jgi:hypothetical protein
MSPSILKPINEVNIPDSRCKYIDRSIEEYYQRISALKLASQVPNDVIQQFEIGKNLLLYSWYVYEFNPVAEMQAFSTTELALKLKIGKGTINTNKLYGLKRLLNYAINQNWIVDEGFPQYWRIRDREIEAYKNWQEIMKETGEDFQIPNIVHGPQDYTKLVLSSFPSLRNEIAHGSTHLSPRGISTLELCRDIINQLFN